MLLIWFLLTNSFPIAIVIVTVNLMILNSIIFLVLNMVRTGLSLLG